MDRGDFVMDIVLLAICGILGGGIVGALVGIGIAEIILRIRGLK